MNSYIPCLLDYSASNDINPQWMFPIQRITLPCINWNTIALYLPKIHWWIFLLASLQFELCKEVRSGTFVTISTWHLTHSTFQSRYILKIVKSFKIALFFSRFFVRVVDRTSESFRVETLKWRLILLIIYPQFWKDKSASLSRWHSIIDW